MTKCADLLDDITQQLHGWGATQDRFSPLSADIGTGDSTFQVDAVFSAALGVAPGLVEIDGEQLYVSSVDAGSGTCTVANFGRGFNGTTATAHTAGAKVIQRPRYPRQTLFRWINNIIGSVFPDLYAVGRYNTVVTYPSNTYTIPGATPMFVIDAQWQDPIGNWYKAPAYMLDPYDSTFRLGGGALIGRPLRVVYAKQPGFFASEGDDFEATTGLPTSCADVLTLGVVAKLAPAADLSRTQITSVEQQARSPLIPPNAGISVAKYLMAEYQDRLRNEAQGLRKQYKSRLVKVW